MKTQEAAQLIKFYTISYWDMQYLRGGNQQKVQKKYRLFLSEGIVLKFLPTAPYVLRYSDLKSILKKEGDIKTKLDNKPGKLKIKYKGSPTEEQAEVLSVIKERCEKYWYMGGLIVMKTGRGKSHMIAQIIDYYKKPTLISVHNKKTLVEMVEKLNEFLGGKAKVGMYYSDKKIMGDIIVTTHTSLSLKKGEIKIKGKVFKPEVLLYDEADRNLSPKMIEAFCNMSENTKIMYGLTGTPQAKNLTEKDLNKIFGKSIRSDKGGYNLVPVVKYIRFKTTTKYLYTNWQEYRECLIEDEYRTAEQIKYIKHVMKYRNVGLLMSDRRIEVERYYELLKDEDFEVVLIHGDTKVQDDTEAISNTVYQNKKTLIIGTSGKMSRGVDIPPIDTIFLFYPNKFESATIQAVGRGLRNFEGKDNTLLVDWADFEGMGKSQMYSRWKTYREEYGLAITSKNEAVSID